MQYLAPGRHRVDNSLCQLDRFGLADEPVGQVRLDHAFATPALLPRITACRYSHAEREAKVSDHSALILEIK